MNKLLLALFLAAALTGYAAASRPQAPAKLNPPAGEKLALQASGVGDQIYVCQPDPDRPAQFAWTLKAPDAKLLDANGKQIGRHFAGPTWEATDGSQVTAKLSASSASPDSGSITWLLLTAVTHSGTGALSKIASIQRLHTKGGKAPGMGCDAAHRGDEKRAAYTADYYFYSR
jgi:FtsP/CotA-like multicopper oxidase with cupredoxin domain